MTGVAAAAQRDAASIGRRRAGAIVAIAVVAFAAAFGIGSATKQTTHKAPAGTLAPATGVAGAQHASVTALSSASGIPALAKAAKPKPKPKASSGSATTATTASTPVSGGTVIGGGSTGGTTSGGGSTGGGSTGGGSTGGGGSGAGGSGGGGGGSGGGVVIVHH
jgi:hypothetical protein